MYCLKIRQLIIIRVYTRAEEQSCIAPVNDLTATSELDEVRLMFLVSRRDKSVYFALQLDLFVVVVRAVPLR